MNFFNGTPLDADAAFIELQGEFTRQGTVNVFEALNGNTTNVVLQAQLISNDANIVTPPVVRFPRYTLQDVPLTNQVSTYTGLVPLQKYRLYCNTVYDLKVIFAKYGAIAASGIETSLANIVASTNDDYAYQIDFYAFDIPRLLSFAKNSFSNSYLSQLQLVNNLTFDIADYQNDRQIAFQAIQTVSRFPRLSVSLNIVANELQISCIDTTGKSAAQHISEQLNIAEVSMQCRAIVQFTGIDNENTTVQQYRQNIANFDYSDDTIFYTLANCVKEVVAADITVRYVVDINTLSESLTFTSRLVLTDQQIAALVQLTEADLYPYGNIDVLLNCQQHSCANCPSNN